MTKIHHTKHSKVNYCTCTLPVKRSFLISRKGLSEPFSTAKLQEFSTLFREVRPWLTVPSCVFTALSTVLTALLCGFIISFSGAAWHLQELTMQLPADVGQKASSAGGLRAKQKPSQHHPWPAGQGKTLRVFGKSESFHYAKAKNVQRDFLVLQKRGENDEACIHRRILYCKNKRRYFQPLNAKE